MPRNVTVTFSDGSVHTYQNAPDDITPEQVSSRAQKEFGLSVVALDGGRKSTSSRPANPSSLSPVGSALRIMGQAGFEPAPRQQEAESGGIGSALTDVGMKAFDMLPSGIKAGVAGTAGLFVRAQSGAAARDAAQDDGFIDRSGSMLERGWQGTAGGIARAAGTIAPGSVGATIRQSARTLEDASAAPIAGEKTWDDLKANPTIAGFGQYVVEQGLTSLPEMALLATPGGLAVSATGRAGNIAQNRAGNDGREDANLGDLAIGGAAGGASALLDKFGLDTIFKAPGANFATRIGRAAGFEAGTEALQGVIEGVGGSAGTQAGVDWRQIADDAAAGAAAGAGIGGGIRTGIEISSGIGKRLTAKSKREQLADGDVSLLTDADKASPIPNDVIAAGKGPIAQAEAESIEAAVLQKAGMPGIGADVAYEIPGKPAITGRIEGAFSEMLDGERVAGIIIRTADGKILRDHFDDIADAGAVVRPVGPEDFTAAADALDAQLRAGAQAPAPLAPATASLQPPVLAQDQISTPSSAANRFDMGRYMAKNRRAESGGNDQAKAATSSASGRYQFTDGTWLQYHAKVFGNTGETREQILAKKRDGAVQDRLMMELTSDNAKALRGAGLPVNDANLYLAHFLGIGGALKLLRAGPSAPLSEAIDAKQIAANKAVFKGRQTAGDVIAWAAAKMGQPVDPASMAGGAAMPQGQGTEYADVDFGTARRAPVAPIEIRTEERDEVITTARDRDVKVRYGVVEARDLVASNTPDGRVNPNYPADMQPRDRTRASSQMQIQQISSKLRPYWLGRTFRPDDGAPVISPDGVVESGNGRTIAIQQVYEQGGPKAEEYRRFVETQGIDTTGMQQPVLVRLRTEQMAPEEARQFAREANMATSLGMAPTEQAFADSDALPEGIMSLYQGGDVDAAANRDFVRRYMDSVMSPGEAANLRRADGSPNPRAFARIRNAMLAQAYDNPRLVENLSESNDSNIVAIGGALTDLAGIWSKMRQEIASGQIAPEYDITANLNEAIEIVERSRREGRPLVDLVNQREMFTGAATDPVTEAVLRLLYNRPDFTKPVGRKRVRERLQAYLDDVSRQRLDQGNLLDEPAAPDVAGAVRAARGMEGYEDATAPVAAAATEAAEQPANEPGPPSTGPSAPAGGEQDARPGREGVPPQRGEQAGSVSPEATVKPDLTVEQVAPDAQNPENLKAAPPSIAGQKIDDEWTAFAPSSGTLGVPRADMPQVKAEHRGALVNFLNARGIEHREQTVDPASLKPTQAEFSPAKVAKAREYEGGNRAILVSADNHVVDGHHQWMAARDAGEEIRIIRLDAPIARLLEVVPEMPSATTAEGATDASAPDQPDMLGGPTADERRQALERRGNEPMRGRGEQRPAGSDGGLFDTAAPQQADLLDAASPTAEPAPQADVTNIAEQVSDAEREARNRRLLDQAVPATDGQAFKITSSRSPGVVRLVMTPELARREALSIAQSSGQFDEQFDAIMAYTGGNATFGPVSIEFGPMENLTGVTPTGQGAATAPEGGAQQPDDAPEAETPPDGQQQRPVRRSRARRQSGGAQPIEDAGEKIGGARKDQWAERGLSVADLDGMSEGEAFQYVTKDQVWPKPDYAKMVEDGVDPTAAAMLKLMRDRLAAKPRVDSAEGRRAYVEMMALLREEYGKVKTADDMRAARDRVVHERIGWPRGYGMTTSVTPEMRALLFSVYKGRREPFSASNDKLKARKMVDSGFPAPQAPWASRYEVLTKRQGEWFVYRRGGYSAKAGPFPTIAEAEAAAAQAYADERAAKKDDKGQPVRPYLDVIERTGADVRSGRDIDSQDFIDSFGFRGVEFGNWLAGDERQRSVNLAFEALHDLAATLKIPAEALSLGGKLGLAFGSRGKGKAAAHYEPGKLVINLTKMSGAGSLAHEWGHALDHYFGELDRPETSAGAPRGASGWYRQTDSRIRDLANLRPEMAAAFDKLIKALFKQEWTRAVAVRDMELRLENLRARRERVTAKEPDMIKMLDGAIESVARDLATARDETKPLPVLRNVETSFYQNAKRLSGKAGADGYWARPTEMFARAFEAFVFDRIKEQGERSDYLVQGVEPDRYAGEQYKGNPYPAGPERDAINQAFSELFEQMDVRESPRGPELFSIEDGEILPTDPLVELEGNEIGVPDGAEIDEVRSAAQRWYRTNLLSKSAKSANGWTIAFNLRGMKKTLRGGEYLLRAVPAIRQIIEQGSLVESRPGDQTGTKAMHLFASDVSINGDVRRVGVFVRETPEGRFQYSLNQMGGKGPAKAGRDNAKASIAPASEGTLAELNLILLDEIINAAPPAPAERTSDTGIDPAKVEQFHADLAQQLQNLGLADKVMLSVVERIAANPKAAGSFQDGLIRVALASSQDPAFTLNHEAIHALRGMRLLNDMEWATLSRRARDDAALMASIKRRYPDLDAEAQMEEAIADMYARWADRRLEGKGFVRAAFERLRSFIEAVSNALRGLGFRTAADIMRAVQRGDVGQRTMDADGANMDGERFSVPNDGTMERQRGPFDLFGGREGAVTDMVDALRAKGPLGRPDPTWKGKAADAWDQFRFDFQDQFLPLKKAQRIIERSFGKPLADEIDAYRGEELMHGRIAERVDRLHEGMVRPLFDAMAEEDVSIEAFESYLYARHAPERNAQIAKINPEMEGAGSGMTDVQAAAIMARIERDGKKDAMERLAARVDTIREATLDAQTEYGLISQERAAELRETYKHYVPLRGFKESEGTDPAAAARINRSGGGINVRGPEGKRAFGRRSEADSPLAYLLLQAEEAVVRGETNRVAQEFYRLAESSPNPDFWETQKITTGRRINSETGLVESYTNTLLTQADAPYTVVAKFDGKERRVTLNRENPAALRLADAMRNMTNSKPHLIVRMFGAVTRWYSAVATRFNPDFVLPNMFRDIQSALVNIQDVDADGLTAAIVKHYPGALRASMSGAFNKGSGEWGKWYDEFALAGGKTAYAQMSDIGQLKDEIEKKFALAASRAGKDKSAMLLLKRTGSKLIETVENLNDGVENAVRLAAYRGAREAGLSEKQAGSIAKNVTVNFNRKGRFGPFLNSFYMFFNASTQGNVRLLQAIYYSKKAKKIVVGVAVAGLMMEMLNSMLSADDDDGEAFYDKIPSFEKERNIIIMMPDGKDYIKIPVAYGLNAFWNIGRTAGEIGRRGGDRWQESAANLAGTIVGAFNPFGFSFENRGLWESFISLAMPSAFDPAVDLSQNKDFMGKPIRPEEKYGPQDPEFRRYFKGVGEHWKALTDSLNEMTGGNKVEAGAVSVSPEVLEYLANTAFGAAGGFFDRLASIPNKIATGDITVNDVPLARKVTGEKSPYQDRSTFYERLNEVEAAVKGGNDLVEAEMTPELERYIEDNRRVLTLEEVTKEARKITRQISKDRRLNDGMLEKGKIDATAHEANKKQLDEIEATVVLNYNRQWVSTVYKGEQAATE